MVPRCLEYRSIIKVSPYNFLASIMNVHNCCYGFTDFHQRNFNMQLVSCNLCFPNLHCVYLYLYLLIFTVPGEESSNEIFNNQQCLSLMSVS